MTMTMVQKIIAAHCGRESVHNGEIVLADVDMVMSNDITGAPSIAELEANGFDGVFDINKVALVLDHFVPCKDIKAAEQCAIVRTFAKKHNIKHYYDEGRAGIEHALLPEQGIVGSGDIVTGADSHTCTYGALGAFSTGMGSTDIAFTMATGKTWLKVPAAIRFVLKNKPADWVSGKDVILTIIGMIGVGGATYNSMEFCGGGLKYLSMDDRVTISNMAVEAGGKCGIFETDEITRAYEKTRRGSTRDIQAGPAEAYEKTVEIDLSQIKPTVAMPHLPENAHPAEELGDVTVDQAVIGSCTNGRLGDLAAAAKIFEGRKVHPNVRAIIIPATQEIYREALRLGYIKTFLDANCVVSTPTCGPCLGGYMGVLAKGERAISTTNRNFVGRMGHPESEICLASPAVAAASAIAGHIASPEEIMKGARP